MENIILYSSDIEKFEKVSRKTALKRIKAIKKEYNIPKDRNISIVHYAKYNRITLEEMKKMMDLFKVKNKN